MLVTGAGAGIGRGISLAFAAAGASVVLGVRKPDQGEAVAEEVRGRGGRAEVVACDVTDPVAVAAAVARAQERFGRLDAVVHNASSPLSSQPVELAEVDPAQWDEHRAVALDAAFHLARASHAPLRAAQGALLVLTSPAGIEGSSRLPFYAMAKAAQRGFVKALAHEWGPDGIRVNGLAPLGMSPAMHAAFAATPDLEPTLAAAVPLGRIGDAEHDIGPAAVFLCGDDARYVTGQTLVVSGGRFTLH